MEGLKIQVLDGSEASYVLSYSIPFVLMFILFSAYPCLFDLSLSPSRPVFLPHCMHSVIYLTFLIDLTRALPFLLLPIPFAQLQQTFPALLTNPAAQQKCSQKM